MKRISRILILAVILFTGLSTASAQSVQLIVNQRVAVLPSTVTNYIDDPFRYFNVQFNVFDAGPNGLDVFLGLNATGKSMYVRTKAGSHPHEPIHLVDGPNILRDRDVLIDQLRNKRLEVNPPEYGKLNSLGAQQLPEGTYDICVYVYLWSDRLSPNPAPIAEACIDVEICYSGSAPELVSPMAGAQLPLNGAMVLTPSRKVDFIWTPVISNCSGKSTRFKYILKVVKVLAGQNYQDAIKYNPTVFSAEVRDNTFVQIDTLRDVKVQLEKGALYVAQVRADQILTGRSSEAFIVANDGNSQPLPFYWGGDGQPFDLTKGKMNLRYNTEVDDEFEEDDETEGIDGLTHWSGGAEEESGLDAVVDGILANEPKVVLLPNHHYVKSDGYYTIPMSNDIEIGFTPAQYESLKSASYSLALYDYVEDGVDSITAQTPLHTERLEAKPENRTLAGWGANLKQGNLYYLQLSSTYQVSYWDYVIADTNFYVNDMLAEHIHDTVSRNFVETELSQDDGIYFQWGDDPQAPAFTTPQWEAPVNRTKDDIHNKSNYTIPTTVPEVKLDGTFPISWTPVKNIKQGDEATYEVKVYELKQGQTLGEALSSNEPLASRTVTKAHAITDAKFFKVFSPSKTYVMTLSTDVNSENNSYHFENGSQAIPIIFKVTK